MLYYFYYLYYFIIILLYYMFTMFTSESAGEIILQIGHLGKL